MCGGRGEAARWTARQKGRTCFVNYAVSFAGGEEVAHSA